MSTVTQSKLVQPLTAPTHRMRKGRAANLRWTAAPGFSGFNVLLNVVERHPGLIAKPITDIIPGIFRFNLADRKSPDKFLTDYFGKFDSPEFRSHMEDQQENFFFPHQYCAIQDDCGCVILCDLEPDKYGLNKKIAFIDISPAHIVAEDDSHPEAIECIKGVMENYGKQSNDRTLSTITSGVIYGTSPMQDNETHEGGLNIRQVKDKYGTCLYIRIKESCLAGKKEVIFDQVEMDEVYLSLDDTSYKGAMTPCPVPVLSYNLSCDTAYGFGSTVCNNVVTALEEVSYINDPRNFRVEVSHKKVIERYLRYLDKTKNKKKKKKKYPRMDEAPCDTVMTATEFHTYTGYKPPNTPDDEKADRKPHWRRQHIRILRSEKWGDKQGKRIIVKACWVGPEEAMVGGKTYKVRLTEPKDSPNDTGDKE